MNKRKYQCKRLILSQSAAVFGEAIVVLGSRRARLTPILQYNEANDIIISFLCNDLNIYSIKSGRFLNRNAINHAWNKLNECGEDRNAIWRLFLGLGIESVKFTRTVLSE